MEMKNEKTSEEELRTFLEQHPESRILADVNDPAWAEFDMEAYRKLLIESTDFVLINVARLNDVELKALLVKSGSIRIFNKQITADKVLIKPVISADTLPRDIDGNVADITLD